MLRGSAGYVEPGAIVVFGDVDSTVRLIEVVAAADERRALVIWTRECGGSGVERESEMDLSNHVTWWPTC